ncbi:MAG: ABC transporter ATP-binding protein [Anaerolineales bacterium]|nr:ABC transporter ATP-binding protein [Anaerolineales bacterium]
MVLIETHDLTKHFGTLAAVEGVSLRVEAGEILALLGPNGAGKTTTIRMLASILRPTRGTAKIKGFDVVQEPIDVRRSVGFLTEHHGLYTRMKQQEYLQFFGQIHKMPATVIRERTTELLTQYGLNEASELRLGQFSKGMRQKLALARTLLHDPAVLLLDEPTSAMDPSSAHMVREGISGLRSSNRAIIVCTHNLHEAEMLADTIAIIRRGRIIANGTPKELKRSLLGDPVMELRLAGPLDGALKHLPPDLKTLAMGKNWLRYQVGQPEIVNPKVLQAMTEAGVNVITLSEVGRSLEDVYLQVVAEGENGFGSRGEKEH